MFRHWKTALAVAAIVAGTLAAPAAVQARTPDDQLVVAFSMTNLLNIDPSASGSKEKSWVMTNVYEQLVGLDPIDRSVIHPVLAESWVVSEDGSRITFTMREGLVFASGNPLTAYDVEWSLHRVMQLNLSSAAGLRVRGFNESNYETSFVAEDERTFVINLPGPDDPNIIIMMLGTSGAGSVIDSQLVLENEVDGDLGEAYLANNSAGSGPYVISQVRTNELILLDRNENYWGEPPAMRRVVMRHLPESQSQRLQLERGDIDIAYSLAAPDLVALAEHPDIVVETGGGGGFYYLAASQKNEILSDRNVRLALRYLIDYEGINEAVMPYYGVSHQRPVHRGLLGDLPSPGYTLDVERAKEYLAAAGYPDGFPVTIRTLSDAPFINIATAIQATLAEGGIEAEILAGSGDQTYGAMRERSFELLVGRSGGTIPHPDTDMRSLAYNPDNSDEARLVGMQGWRASFFDAELNDMIDAAVLETDPDAQREMYEAIQLRYEELVPAIQPISQVADSVAFRSDVKGLIMHPSWETDLSLVYKER